jgi:hypothetical protein
MIQRINKYVLKQPGLCNRDAVLFVEQKTELLILLSFFGFVFIQMSFRLLGVKCANVYQERTLTPRL